MKILMLSDLVKSLFWTNSTFKSLDTLTIAALKMHCYHGKLKLLRLKCLPKSIEYFSKTLPTLLLTYVINFTHFAALLKVLVIIIVILMCHDEIFKASLPSSWRDVTAQRSAMSTLHKDSTLVVMFHFLPVHTMMTQVCETAIKSHDGIFFISRVLCKATIWFTSLV